MRTSRSMSAHERAYYRELGGWALGLRRALGLSQRKLAAELGVHPDAIGRWEHGRAPIAAYVVHRLKEMAREKRSQP